MSTEPRYYVYPFDLDTYVVADHRTGGEICVCGEYDEAVIPAKERAETICRLLNEAPADLLTDGIPEVFKAAQEN